VIAVTSVKIQPCTMIYFYLGQFVIYAIVAFLMFALEQKLNAPKRKK
jgi:hypothetical protein